MGLAKNQAIYQAKQRTFTKRELKWRCVPYGNNKAEIQDKLGVLAVVRSIKLAKHICKMQQQFCMTADDKSLKRILKG